MKRLTKVGVWAMAWGIASIGFGANLGAWDLTADGTGTTDEPGKVTVGDFVGGSGIGAITFGGNGAYANSWSTDMSVDPTDYFEVTLAPQAGYGLLISGIDYSERRSSTGIREFQVRVSTNNFSSHRVLETNAVPDDTNERSYSIDGLSLDVAEGQTFRLRFYGYQAEAGTGTWRINNGTLKIMGTAISLAGPPTVSFDPGSDVSVHVSNLLEVAVSVLPPGSGIQGWDMDPDPDGATSLVGGSFNFTPVESDDGQSFTLEVVATNSYGISTGTLDIAVTEYLPPGTYEITFDNAGEVKTSYDSGAVTLNGREWILEEARIGDTENDVKLGLRAARFGSFYPAFMTSSNVLLPAGLGTVSFQYAQYAGGDAGAELVVEVATDVELGDWVEIGRVNANGVTELTEYRTDIDIHQAMYFRIRTDYHPDVGQVNVDSILIQPYQAPVYSAYEEYLLQYNVTPGDSGTGPAEDWDGDGFSNTNEFDAATNPYDADSHP